MNFFKIVNEILLTEDPDYAEFEGLSLPYTHKEARPFFILNITFRSDPKISYETIFYGTKKNQAHEDLTANILYMDHSLFFIQSGSSSVGLEPGEFTWPPEFETYPLAIKERMTEVFSKWNGHKPAPYKTNEYKTSKLPSGRYWIAEDKFFISMWKGSEESIKRNLRKVVPIWNPDNLPFYYQAPGEEEDQWVDGNTFLESQSAIIHNTSEIDKIEKEINVLLPLVHVESGAKKQSIKLQIKNLQNKIKELGGTSKSVDDEISSKGSYKLSQIAGLIPLAKMNALKQTSESKTTTS